MGAEVTSCFVSPLFDIMGNRPIKCEGPSPASHPTAFPEHAKQVPLGPKMDKDQGIGAYKKYDESQGPFPEAFDFANQLKITEEQVNQSYEHQLHGGGVKAEGQHKPQYSSNWERAVAYHHGLYVPEM